MALGEEVSRAQSSGEWPGVSCTFLRGLVGIALWVGGGASENVDGEELLAPGPRLGRGPRGPDDACPMLRNAGWACTVACRGGPSPPEARWAELSAGNAGAVGSSSLLMLGMLGMRGGGMASRSDARCAELATADEAGDAGEERVDAEKVGTAGRLPAARCAEFAAGNVGALASSSAIMNVGMGALARTAPDCGAELVDVEFVDVEVVNLKDGGGISLRSASCFALTASASSRPPSPAPSDAVSVPDIGASLFEDAAFALGAAPMVRWNRDAILHVDGGCR